MLPAIVAKISYVFAAGCNLSDGTFFGFPHWWQYLGGDNSSGSCTPALNSLNDIWAIGIAVLDMLLYLAGIVAVISIIIAGITYVTSVGNSEKTTGARRRIVNSLVGLAIVVSASVLVSFIGNKLS